MTKKILKWLFIALLIFVLGGIGGIFFEKYLVPVLGKSSFFGKYHIFQQMEKNTTIINKTERIVVRDNNLINEVSSNAVSSVVTVFSFLDDKKSIKKNALSKKISNSKSRGKKGAGVILTNDGVIVTYSDNIFKKDATYEVVIFDGSIYEAKLLGVDTFTNLAYLRVEGVNLPAIPFVNSDDVDLGKKVIVMGHSQGRNKISLTEGVLSDFKERFNLSGKTVSSSEKLEGVFDIAFDEDEKYVGGPVIDYNGEMIAITEMMKIDNKDIYFQIPVNIIKESMAKISNNGLKQNARLGIYYISIDKFNQKLYDLSIKNGAIIYAPSGEQGLAIISGSSAEKAGLKINDIIIAVDGKNIDLEHPLSNYINEYKKGDEIKLKILRNNKEIEVRVKFI